MSKSIVLYTVLVLLSASLTSSASDDSCAVRLRSEEYGMDVALDSCSNIGSFSMGGFYGGSWEKLTYNYPQPWKGTFISVKVDDILYASSENPSDSVLMDRYVSRLPVVEDSTAVTEWMLPGKVRVVQSITLAENRTLIELQAFNMDYISHDIGVRIYLDTMLGFNDGAPIYLPGEGLKVSEVDYGGGEVVFEYWKAYNRPEEPTIVATGLMDPKAGMTMPSRILVSEWKQSKNHAWDYDTTYGLSILGDSAVALYYPFGMVDPGESGVALTGFGSEAPVLPPEKGSYGITEVVLDRVSGKYCPHEDVKVKVDVLSDGAVEKGSVMLLIADVEGSIYYNNTIEGVFPDGEVRSLMFAWPVDEEVSRDYDVRAFLYGDQGMVDSKTRESLVKVDVGGCIDKGIDIMGPVKSSLSCVPYIILFLVLVIAGFFAFLVFREMSRGEVVVSKTQDSEYVRVVVSNRMRKVLKDVIVEDAIPENAELDVKTLNVLRKRDYLVWDLGDLKPGSESIMEYHLKHIAMKPEVVVKWRGGVVTHKAKT
ncbi:MAG: hypothetical protein ABIH11_06635 [Candidatus Altiarchaeota archaeon]